MNKIELGHGDALLIVDVQNDFLPGGRLGVAHGDEVLGPLDRYLDFFNQRALPVYATRDWHPPDHCSFSAQGGIWPPHCIAGSQGAAFPPELALPERTIVISKALDSASDAYSGFQGTGLAARLRTAGVSRLFIGGLATDYCVLNTVSDALREGFKVVLLTDAIRAVDLQPGDGAAAVARMTGAGARPASVSDIADAAPSAPAA